MRLPRLRQLNKQWHINLGYIRFPREMHFIALSVVLANLGMGAESTFFAMYVRDLGATMEQLGAFLSGASLAGGVLTLVGGWASDRYDRILMMSIGAWVGALAYCVKAFAPAWAWLIPAEVLTVLGGIIVSPAVFGVVSGLAPVGQLGRFFGYLNTSMQVAFVLGPMIGGWVYQHWGYRTMLWALTVAMIVAGLLRFFVRDRSQRLPGVSESRPTVVAELRNLFHVAVRDSKLWHWLLATTLPLVGAGLIIDVTPVYLREINHFDYVQLGVLGGFTSVAGIPGAFLGGLMADRFNLKSVAALFALGWVVQAGGLLSLRGFWPIMVCLMAAVLLRALAQPAISAYTAHVAGPEHTGIVYAAMKSMNVLVGIPWPAVAGFIWQRTSARELYLLSFLLLCASLVMFWVLVEPIHYASEGVSRNG